MIIWLVFVNHFCHLLDVTLLWKMSSAITVTVHWSLHGLACFTCVKKTHHQSAIHQRYTQKDCIFYSHAKQHQKQVAWALVQRESTSVFSICSWDNMYRNEKNHKNKIHLSCMDVQKHSMVTMLQCWEWLSLCQTTSRKINKKIMRFAGFIYIQVNLNTVFSDRTHVYW